MSSRTSNWKVVLTEVPSVWFAHRLNVVSPIGSVGVPLIVPVAVSRAIPVGSPGYTSKVVPGDASPAGWKPAVCEFLNPKNLPPKFDPCGLSSGPARHIGGTALGPSQIPSESVSGFSGSVPVSEPSTYVPVSVSIASSSPSPSSSVSASLPIPSPSVSSHSAGSRGKASGPASQTPATAIGPSQCPSPSVSGSSGSVAGSEDASAASSIPSPSSS